MTHSDITMMRQHLADWRAMRSHALDHRLGGMMIGLLAKMLDDIERLGRIAAAAQAVIAQPAAADLAALANALEEAGL